MPMAVQCSARDQPYATRLLEGFALIKEQKIKGLSHGQRVKTTLMRALARRPKYWCLMNQRWVNGRKQRTFNFGRNISQQRSTRQRP